MLWELFVCLILVRCLFYSRAFFCHVTDQLQNCKTRAYSNGGLLKYYFICTIISLFDLVSMCKIQKNSYFQTRSERLIISHIKEYINKPPIWKSYIALLSDIRAASSTNQWLYQNELAPVIFLSCLKNPSSRLSSDWVSYLARQWQNLWNACWWWQVYLAYPQSLITQRDPRQDIMEGYLKYLLNYIQKLFSVCD